MSKTCLKCGCLWLVLALVLFSGNFASAAQQSETKPQSGQPAQSAADQNPTDQEPSDKPGAEQAQQDPDQPDKQSKGNLDSADPKPSAQRTPSSDDSSRSEKSEAGDEPKKEDPRQPEADKPESRQAESDKPESKQGDQKQAEGNQDSRESRATRSFFGSMVQDSNREQSKRSKEMVSLIKPLVVSAEASTVKILSGTRLISLGTVVDGNGLILTKASELSGELNCKLADGRKSKAVVVGVHPDTDLALLKIEISDLPAIHWGSDPIPAVGQWVMSPTLDDVQVGIVGVNVRKIPPSSPFLGIGPPLGSTEEVVGAKIDSVQPNTPADDVDLMVGDIITKIDDVDIKSWDDLRKTLGQYDPKDEVTLTIQRGKEELKIKAILGDREKLQGGNFPQQDRSAMQNSMGSRPSQRRKDFPMAFQHDLGLNKTTCGGPVINLNGQVVGINIARAGRVDSLALPVNTILPVLEMLKSGELAPAKVNSVRLSELEKELAEVDAKLKAIPETRSLENQLMVEKARKEELDRARAEMQKAIEELENRIKVVDMKKGNFEKELKSMKSERNALDRKKFGLERERKSLSTGVR